MIAEITKSGQKQFLAETNESNAFKYDKTKAKLYYLINKYKDINNAKFINLFNVREM